MIQSILGGIQSLMNFLFVVGIFGTAGFSWWLSKKYEERFAEFPWKKAGIIIGIEVLSWIGFTIFWNWVERNLWIGLVVIGIIVVVMVSKRKDKYAI